MSKRVIITLDYELGMGETPGTINKCLIEPMDAMTKMLEKHPYVKLSFFVDGAYLLRLKQLMNLYENVRKDYDKVIKHISQLQKLGHDIQYHFHPQWLYSNFDGNGWIMDLDHYKLSDVDEPMLKQSFSEGLRILRQETDRVIAFRAGGYSLETYTKYSSLLRDNGIIIDSSVLPGAKSHTSKQFYDYSCTPEGIYKFSNDFKSFDEKGDMIEAAIATKKISGPHYAILKREVAKLHGGSRRWADCRGIGDSISFLEKMKNKINRFVQTSAISATFDWIFSEHLGEMYRFYKGEDFVMIGHPKAQTPKSIDNLNQFISSLDSTTQIIPISQII